MRRAVGLVAATLAGLAGLPAGSDAHLGNYPIVLIHGWTSSGDTFRELIPKLTAQGLTVLDFDTATPGIQAMSYAPTASGQHISYIAAKIVEEKIKTALTQNGYNASTQPIDIINALGYTSSQNGTGRAYLAGDAFVRLEYFNVVQDHDNGTTDEFRFDVYVDRDGNNDGYTFVQTLSYNRDAPFTQNWGNTGPGTLAVNLPGSPRAWT